MNRRRAAGSAEFSHVHPEPNAEMRRPVEAFGFQLLQVSGSHHIYARLGLREQINLQDVRGKAKPYQIRQFLKLVERYNLRIEEK
jgi:hypothetical protein